MSSKIYIDIEKPEEILISLYEEYFNRLQRLRKSYENFRGLKKEKEERRIVIETYQEIIRQLSITSIRLIDENGNVKEIWPVKKEPSSW